MPITSILKSSQSNSSSKTKATVIGAKPVTFRHINPSDAYNKDIVVSEPLNGQKQRDSLYAISRKQKTNELEINPTNMRNSSFLRLESPKHEFEVKPKFDRASYSSCSSRCSSSSGSSTYSSTSASLSIPTPPSETCIPPKLPPKTYLTSKPCVAPERPPKKLLINVCNNLEEESGTRLIESNAEMETSSSVASIIASNMKSSSKIECIHFGVV